MVLPGRCHSCWHKVAKWDAMPYMCGMCSWTQTKLLLAKSQITAGRLGGASMLDGQLPIPKQPILWIYSRLEANSDY